jgi:hypothetical protein
MDQKVFSTEKEVPELVQVLKPPGDLKPAEGFRRILAEFKNWIGANPDKAYRAFLWAGGMDQGPEDTTWAIRKALRQGRDQNGGAKPSPALKWHLVLHLAQEIEDDRQEAETLLRALREKDSPLKGTVEEEGAESLFYDLPAFGEEPIMEENRLLQVYEAWFSLFGGRLKDHELLVTTSPQVVAHVSGVWQEYVLGAEEAAETQVAFRVPDLSHLRLEDLLRLRAQALEVPVLGEVRKAILAVWEDPKAHVSFLKERAGEIEAAFPGGEGDGNLLITMNYLKEGVPERIHAVWGAFSGKTLILVSKEETS